jgi:hypothetical protein
VGGEDFERERQDYFDRLTHVGFISGTYRGWSRLAWGIGWHPAMIPGRSGRPSPPPTLWDWIRPVVFLAVVLGVPALAIFMAADTPNWSTKLVVVFGVAGGIVWLVFVSAHLHIRRTYGKSPRQFPHPGPKGRHVHR